MCRSTSAAGGPERSATRPWATSRPRWRAWYGARSLSREAFRTQFFTPYTSDAVIDDVRAAARGMIEGRSYDELAMAAGELATAARTVGADNWQRFLGSSSRQAVEAVSRGEVPGVVKIGAEAEVAGVARLTVLGLLAIIHEFRLHPPHPRPAPSLPGIVLQAAPKDAKTAPQSGQDGGWRSAVFPC